MDYDHVRGKHLVSWLLLLAKVKSKKGDTGDLDDLEAAAGNITLGLTSLTETRNKDFVLRFINYREK